MLRSDLKITAKLSIIFGCALSLSGNAQTPQTSSTLAVPSSSISLKKEEPPAPVPKVKHKLEINSTFYGQSMEDKVVNSKMFGGIFEANGDRDFVSYLSLSYGVFSMLMTGSNTNRYTSEGAAPSMVVISKGYIDFHPVEYAAFQFGLLDIDFSSIVSSFFSQGFPGVRTVLKTKGELLDVSLAASETMPTSSTAEVKSSEDGVNTTLSLINLNVSTNPDDKADLTVKGTGSYFKFKNLTSSAATDSQYYGNSVIPVGSQARFKYEYEGTETAAQIIWKMTKLWSLNLSGSQLVNTEAPEDKNVARILSGELTYAMNDVKLGASFNTFENETDTLPASYTSPRYGFNNRFGWSARLKSEFVKEKTMVFVRFVQANVIETKDKPYQADRQIISLGLEAKYDIF